MRNHKKYARLFVKKGMRLIAATYNNVPGGEQRWHILMDARAVINGGVMKLQSGKKIEIPRWDLIIAHPPCTYLSHVATRHHSLKTSYPNWINARTRSRIDAMTFFMDIVYADCDKIAIENPVGIMNTAYRKPDQIIHPYQFAADENDKENYVTKATCLWLKSLKPLDTNDLEKPNNGDLYGYFPTGKARCWTDHIFTSGYERSKTFPGVAKAMAEQWGDENYVSKSDDNQLSMTMDELRQMFPENGNE